MPRPSLRILRSALTLVLALSASPAGAQVLYWLDTSFGAPAIHQADAGGNPMASVPLGAGSLPEGLAADANGKLYWAEAAWSGARLVRAAPTLASITPILTGGSAFRGIAVDDVDQRLYWTSSNLVSGAMVHRAALDGGGATPWVVLPAGANPRGIAVDHSGGRLYWADFGLNAIYRANLDGSGAEAWVPLSPGALPYGVAFDPSTQHVYWTEYGSGSLQRINTSGSGNQTVLSGLANPTYLTLDVPGGVVYWAEGGFGNQHLRRATTNGSSVVTLPSPLTTFGGLAFRSDGTVSLPAPPPPTEFALDRLWPNPGSGPTHVRFSLPREARVRLSVFDLQGREVAVLADGAMPAGRHERSWSAGASGTRAGAGIYFVRLVAGGQVWARRFVLTR